MPASENEDQSLLTAESDEEQDAEEYRKLLELYDESMRNLTEGEIVLGRVIGRRQEGEQEVHGLLVHGAEVDRLIQLDEHAVQALQALQPRMRDSDPVAHPRRSQALARHQLGGDIGRGRIHETGGDLGDDGKGLTLRRGVHLQGDRALIQQFT